MTKKTHFLLQHKVLIEIVILILGLAIIYDLSENKNISQNSEQLTTHVSPSALARNVCTSNAGIKELHNLPYKVAFIRDGSLWLYENGREKQLTKNRIVINRLTIEDYDYPTVRYKFSKDGNTLYYVVFKEYTAQNGYHENLPLSIHAVDVDTGAESVVIEESQDAQLNENESPLDALGKKTIGEFDISHDGQKLAYTRNADIWIKDLSTGANTMLIDGIEPDEVPTPRMYNHGHSYANVTWSPTDTSLYASWQAYESSGADIINVSTKNILSITIDSRSDDRPSFDDFITDTRGIFSRGGAMIESGIPIDSSTKAIPVYEIRAKFDDLLDIRRVMYSSATDRIYFLARVQKQSENVDDVYYYDRKLGKLVNMTNDLGALDKNCLLKNWLSETTDAQFIAYNMSNDIVVTSSDGQKEGVLIKNGYYPVFSE